MLEHESKQLSLGDYEIPNSFGIVIKNKRPELEYWPDSGTKMGNIPEGFEKATSGNVVKFENVGDNIVGKFISYEESKQFKGSYALKVLEGKEVKVVFVSPIVIDQIKTNQLKENDEIVVKYLGKKKNQKGTFEYNDYELLFKRSK